MDEDCRSIVEAYVQQQTSDDDDMQINVPSFFISLRFTFSNQVVKNQTLSLPTMPKLLNNSSPERYSDDTAGRSRLQQLIRKFNSILLLTGYAIANSV